MASIYRRADGTAVLQYVDANGNRPQIILGKQQRDGEKLTKRELQPIKSRIEQLVTASITGDPPDRNTLVWVRDLAHDDWGRKLRERLIERGLIAGERKRSTKLIEFVDQYIAGRTDVKPSTRTVWNRCRNHLDRFFDNVQLSRITIGDAKDFRRDLIAGCDDERSPRRGLAEDTVRRTCGVAKQFFGDAVDRKLIDVNPFDHRDVPTATGAGDGARKVFITQGVADQVLAILPDAQWRLMFALARYGGLRCPSEVLTLKWGDVDFEAGRIVVRSPKTEHHDGGDRRVVPMFPELRPYLQAVLDDRETELESDDVAVPLTEPVITRYRRMDSNYGTLLTKLLKASGIKHWPKPFHNLRASRETELAERFPMHVVCEWIGNSTLIAQRHYLQVTDDHFAAASTCTPDQESVQQSVAEFCESTDLGGNERNAHPIELAKTPGKTAHKRKQAELSGRVEWALQDHCRSRKRFSETGVTERAVESVARSVADEDLERVCRAWAMLPEHVRLAIIALCGDGIR
jgi:integrase